MPLRPDVRDVAEADVRAKGLGRNANQRFIDSLQQGDVAVYFIPPHLLEAVLTKTRETHIHDEWTKKKF